MNTTHQSPLLSSQSTEWYTPPNIVSAVVKVMGTIDLDLCSNSTTHPIVRALYGEIIGQ